MAEVYVNGTFRNDSPKAIESLSDILHVNMNNATITRLDVAQNFIILLTLY